MTDTFSFASMTPRFGLPNLFAAQAQKEFTINEALAIIDALLHVVIEGEADEPPATPVEGECWIIGSQPVGNWTEEAGKLACRQGGNWLFLAPVEGMAVFDKSASRTVRYDGGWSANSAISRPTGGATVDEEARTAISEIMDALASAGILPAT